MTKYGLIVMLVTSFTLLAGCTVGGREVRLASPTDGHVIELTVGDVLVLELAGNPTTGYNWYVVDADGSVLQQRGDPEFAPDSSAIGSGGKLLLTFKALAAGESPLVLAYQRTWEVGVSPLETLNLRVVVK